PPLANGFDERLLRRVDAETRADSDRVPILGERLLEPFAKARWIALGARGEEKEGRLGNRRGERHRDVVGNGDRDEAGSGAQRGARGEDGGAGHRTRADDEKDASEIALVSVARPPSEAGKGMRSFGALRRPRLICRHRVSSPSRPSRLSFSSNLLRTRSADRAMSAAV